MRALFTASSVLTALLAVAACAQTMQQPVQEVSPRMELWANLRAELTGVQTGAHGTAWLIVSARYVGKPASADKPSSVTLRIPISSTEDVYGESRSCNARGDRSLGLTFTAGMDEQNFMRFDRSGEPHDFHLLLNKYLCRALASPFHCGSRAVSLPQDWAGWRIVSTMRVVTEPAASAGVHVDTLAIKTTATPFDRARCAVVAPSNGICCVAGKTTEWHCGGTPAGAGWHQVSGECFHRETGGSCHE